MRPPIAENGSHLRSNHDFEDEEENQEEEEQEQEQGRCKRIPIGAGLMQPNTKFKTASIYIEKFVKYSTKIYKKVAPSIWAHQKKVLTKNNIR